MTYSILSHDSKQQLEQERSRLVHERETIIESVTAEINRLIQHIDALLGSEGTAEVNGTVDTAVPTADAAVPTADAAVPAKGTRKGKAKSTTSGAGSPAKSQESAPSSDEVAAPDDGQQKRKRRKSKSFDAEDLNSEFKGLTAIDAMIQVMREAGEQAFSTDEMIQQVYGEFEESEMPRARKSVAGVLARGARFNTFDKVQEKPARYKLSDSVASA
ncbi:MAG: hypothetical protein KME43_15890 [Myxacorys chilensis ATA2-1-KO14]|jgi:hypothetical protein|nr:hypothetical protein [Myxacorys chilensis ATA2-1-KO14]